MKKSFLTNCVSCPGSNAGEAIQAMVDAARDITRRTFLKHVYRNELIQIERDLGYEFHPKRGLTMASDWHVSYHKSVFRGVPCIYFRWSGIEHIFT